MASRTVTGLVQHKTGTASQWASVNPVLAKGALGIENNTYKIKVGDGVTAWNDLPYVGQDNAYTYTISLPVSGWSNGIQTISNTDITADSTVILTPNYTSTTSDMYTAFSGAELCGSPANGSVSIKCIGSVPTIDLICDMVVIR